MKAGILAAVLAASAGAAFGAPTAGQGGSETGDPLLDYKLRTSRAEQTLNELRRSADELVDLSSGLARRVVERGALGPEDTKALDRIRKIAKRVRSEMGGSGDPQMQDPPHTLRDAAAALAECGEALAEQMHKSSRYEMNAKLIALTGEIMLLSDILKQFRE